jgi:hypothetical protein
LKATERLTTGDRVVIQIGKKTTLRGVLHDDQTTDDGSDFGNEIQTLRVQINDLGLRAFSREVNDRGHRGVWQAKARSLKGRGPVHIHLEDSGHSIEHDAAEEDAVREMGGDDFVDYEAATGKTIGAK